MSDFLENPTEDSDIKKRTLNLIDLLMQHDKGHELLQVLSPTVCVRVCCVCCVWY